MSAKPVDPIAAAIEIFLEIKKKIDEDKEKDNVGSKLRSRAREVGELIEEVGLVPALSFLYSKRGDKKKDNKDYEYMFEAIWKYLHRLKFVKNANMDNIDEVIKELDELVGRSYVVLPLLRPFLIEFKRLCEATWEPGRD
ncbi:MAG: type III-B CRISPR module-associated protein Cmr5 [Pyrobaculum sp.]